MSLGLARKTTAYELQDDFTEPTVTYTTPISVAKAIQSTVAQIRLLDNFTAILLLCIIAIVATIVMLIIRNAIGRRSYIYLEVLTQTQCLQFRFAQLPEATRHLVVRVPSGQLSVRIDNYFVLM
jgi:hypothetical protein